MELTSEHKIKASALRKQFGKADLLVGSSGSEERMKAAQSSNSKRLKFEASVCADCNSSLTQRSDREFDRFNEIALSLLHSGHEPASAFDLPQYSEDSKAYLDVFRYFAKLLCCHLAAVDGPIPLAVAGFAIGKTESNRIWLELKRDPFYSELIQHVGECGYAAHGGLVAHVDRTTRAPVSLQSTLTLGALQYVFYTRLSSFESTELASRHARFLQLCHTKAEEALGGERGVA